MAIEKSENEKTSVYSECTGVIEQTRFGSNRAKNCGHEAEHNETFEVHVWIWIIN